MDWKPDRESKIPIYKQLADYIENGIADGTFPPDKPLPSERGLAKELGINRSTVISAYDELEANGLIDRNRGSGTTVSKDIWGIAKKRIPSWNRYIEAGSFLPNLPVTQRIHKEMVEQNLINLASGELSQDLFPMTSLREITFNRSFIGTLGYDHPQGNAILRQTLTNHVKQFRSIETNPSSILITSGAQQALHLVVQCLLKPGDGVAIANPSYHYNLPVFKSAGIKTYSLKMDKEGINPLDITTLYKKHRIRMIFMNPIYQNPTGTLMSEERRKKVLELSSEYGIPIVEDDPYSLTSFTGEKMQTLKSLDRNGNVLYISSLTKIVASGLRIGWIIGPKAVIERLSDAKQQVDYGHASYTQWIANDFLDSSDFEYHIKNLVKQLESRRNQIVVSLESILKDQVDFYIPNGGIHIWCRIKREVNENQLLEESIKRGVIYVPGLTMGSEKGFVRFTFSREKEKDIHEGIKRFADALNAITK
ncbi:PLP-dependent aminotransferase family protein [Bacillus salipaludis]|uniref:PLP-dependent aminotransferase family protein n=1 Tax=Bacillus salipaludis TaxID=2547811 RepID=A0A4R5VQ69_9BACI|nr:PLP-dependent aminotransferase family protein [Bacillus salipaludis]MDQ6598766.1 PLP-dependent aminotransferase family protein [Bacillus salipaludis]TDK60693.1 PLP-dependent aminotransferase family protein [Bacillus salipaludis]